MLLRIDRTALATNFSHCLRNSEHIARYIFEGAWESSQMQIDGTIRNHFKSILSREHDRLMATLPSDLASMETPRVKQPLFDHTQMATFESRKEDFKLADKTYNIVLVGPTGAGKSTITNILFNLSECETKSMGTSAGSVTRDFQVVQGSYKCDKTIKINVVDTMGFCDQFVEDEDAIAHLSSAILAEGAKIDKVVIVVSETPISATQKKALKSLLSLLAYPIFKDHFIFLYNKTENLTIESKMRLVETLGKDLEVDINHKIMVAEPDGALETISSFKAGKAVGVNPANYDDEESRKTITFLKEALLPHCASVLQSAKRLSVPEACSIQ